MTPESLSKVPPARLIQGAAGGLFSRLLGHRTGEVDLRTLADDDAPLGGRGEAALFESPDVAIAAALRADFRGGWRTALVLAPHPDDTDPAQLRFTMLFTAEMLRQHGFDSVRFLRFEDSLDFDAEDLGIVRVPAPERIAARVERPLRRNRTAPVVLALFDGGAEPDIDMIRWLGELAAGGGVQPRVVARDAAACEEAARELPGVHVLLAGAVAPSWLVARIDFMVHAGRRNWMTPFLALTGRGGVAVETAANASGRLSAAGRIAAWRPGRAAEPKPDAGGSTARVAEAWVADVVRLAGAAA